MHRKDLKVMALVLARGGSTGVRGKNIKPINGKPLLAYTIEIAKASKYINKIVVATDNEKIGKIAEDSGAEVPFMRPEEMSQKLSRAYDAYRYFLTKLRKEQDYRPDIFPVAGRACGNFAGDVHEILFPGDACIFAHIGQVLLVFRLKISISKLERKSSINLIRIILLIRS